MQCLALIYLDGNFFPILPTAIQILVITLEKLGGGGGMNGDVKHTKVKLEVEKMVIGSASFLTSLLLFGK